MDKIAERIDQLLSFFQRWQVKDCHEDLKQAILALIEQEQKPMVEALKDAKFVIGQTVDGVRYKSTKGAMLAKIDAVLPKGKE